MKEAEIQAREATWTKLDECRTKARAIAYELRQLEASQVNQDEGTSLEEVVGFANSLVDCLGPHGIGRPWASDEWKKANPIGGRPAQAESSVLAAQRRFWRNGHGSE